MTTEQSSAETEQLTEEEILRRCRCEGGFVRNHRGGETTYECMTCRTEYTPEEMTGGPDNGH